MLKCKSSSSKYSPLLASASSSTLVFAYPTSSSKSSTPSFLFCSYSLPISISIFNFLRLIKNDQNLWINYLFNLFHNHDIHDVDKLYWLHYQQKLYARFKPCFCGQCSFKDSPQNYKLRSKIDRLFFIQNAWMCLTYSRTAINSMEVALNCQSYLCNSSSGGILN